MQQDIGNTARHCALLERSVTALQHESETLLRQDATPAMDALLVLVNRIESLHQATQHQETSALTTYRDPTSTLGAVQARAPLVNACKSQSQIVFGHFRSLSEKARNLTQKYTEVGPSLEGFCARLVDAWYIFMSRMNTACDRLDV